MFIGPFEHHSNELPWRESICDVVTIPEDRDGHIDVAVLEQRLVEHADRPLLIGAFSAASNVTGIVSDTHRIADLLHAPRRPVVLGLRGRGALRRHRDEPPVHRAPALPQGRGLHLAAQVHRRPGDAGCPRRTPGAADQPGPGRARWRDGRLRQPAGAPLRRRPGAPRGGRHAGDRRVDPGRAGLPAEVRRSASRPSGPARRRCSPGRRRVAGPTRRIEILGNLDAERLSIVSFVVRRPGRPAGPGDVPAPQLRGGRCSTTCSASSRAAAARAPGRTGTGCSASTSSARTSSSARSRTAARASSPAGCGSTSTTSSPRPCSTTSSTAVGAGGRARLAAAARLPVRPGHRAVAAPRRAGRAAAAARPGDATTPTAR